MKKNLLIINANYYQDISSGLLKSALKTLPKQHKIKRMQEDLYKDFYQWSFLNPFVILYNIKNHPILLLLHKKRSNTGKPIR